jgi:uncharacterized membrane protein
METIEIRQNKKTLIPMLIVVAVGLLGMVYYVYISGRFENNITMKMVYVFLTALLVYKIYNPTKKLIKNEPVLTLSKSEIKINDVGKPISFLWMQVVDWKIEKEKDGGTQYLIIETAEHNKKINISWLDKRPVEIEELIRTYKK